MARVMLMDVGHVCLVFVCVQKYDKNATSFVFHVSNNIRNVTLSFINSTIESIYSFCNGIKANSPHYPANAYHYPYGTSSREFFDNQKN